MWKPSVNISHHMCGYLYRKKSRIIPYIAITCRMMEVPWALFACICFIYYASLWK